MCHSVTAPFLRIEVNDEFIPSKVSGKAVIEDKLGCQLRNLYSQNEEAIELMYKCHIMKC